MSQFQSPRAQVAPAAYARNWYVEPTSLQDPPQYISVETAEILVRLLNDSLLHNEFLSGYSQDNVAECLRVLTNYERIHYL